MYLSIHPSSGVPIYRQVFQQFRERISSGQLAAGEQLPSVRDLSAEVKVNPLTIAKVYQFLEREGLVETRRGQGTFVACGLKRASAAARRRQLEPALRQLVAEALHLGLGEEELKELTSRTFHAMQKNPKRP